MTELLFHNDSYLKEFEAIVTEVADAGVVLDRTAFYIGGGGQPCDTAFLCLKAKSIKLPEWRGWKARLFTIWKPLGRVEAA